MTSPRSHVPPVRYIVRPLLGILGMLAAVVAYMGIGVGFGYLLGPGGMIGWVAGSMIFGAIYLCALNDWERDKKAERDE